MKKLILVIISALCIGTMFAAEDWTMFKACQTAEEFTAYANREGTSSDRKLMCEVYADALNNPDNYKTFEDYAVALTKLTNPKSTEPVYSYILYISALTQSPMLKLVALQNEAFNQAKESDSKYLYVFYIDSTFCKDNDISAEERFNELVSSVSKNVTNANVLKNVLNVLNNIQFDVDDDIVKAGYKKLYRRYYPIYQSNNDYASVITNIKSSMDAL